MKCEHCDFVPKGKAFPERALKAHVTRKHRGVQNAEFAATVENISQTMATPIPVKSLAPPPVKEVEAPSDEVTFYSAKRPAMTVVIIPDEWRLVTTPNGEKLMPVLGTTIEFQEGRYTSADPVVIAYLEGDRARAKELGIVDQRGNPRVYADRQFPILSSRQMKAMVEKRA